MFISAQEKARIKTTLARLKDDLYGDAPYGWNFGTRLTKVETTLKLLLKHLDLEVKKPDCEEFLGPKEKK